MGKALKYMFGIGAAVVAIGIALFLIFTYWDKITAATSKGLNVAANLLNQFTGDSSDSKESSDYYDI